MKQIRVRIAPSPTGFLHVGTARTALFNFLFARNKNGKFLLRIEDTDLKRSSNEMIDVILESLKWLGLEWDEQPIFQSKRFGIYHKYLKELEDKEPVYRCYCIPGELEQRRKIIIAQGKAWKYDRKCLKIRNPNDEIRNKPYAIRFFVPDGIVMFEDKIHGILKRSSEDIEDFVIMKSDKSPTYNFACCIDDHEMGITHIIRGEDHISNTFKQVLLYKAFGWKPPEFIHIPLILGPDRSKLSKRHGALSVLDYRDQGFLPECFLNFLALLGWSPGEDREIMPIDEIIKRFSLERLSKTPAVFDVNKLEWMNGEYINRLSDEELLDRILSFKSKIPACQRTCSADRRNPKSEKRYMLKVVGILKERMKKLTDFFELGAFFFEAPKEYDEKGAKKFFSAKGGFASGEKDKEISERLTILKERFEKLERFDVEGIEGVIRNLSEEIGISAAKIIHPVRLALTGKTIGPSLFHLTEILGKQEVIQRLENAIKFIQSFS